MSSELASAFEQLEHQLKRGPATVLGPLGTDEDTETHYQELGMRRIEPEQSQAATRRVIIPPLGLPKSVIHRWKSNGYEVIDLTLPSIRRAQVSLGLMLGEGRRPLVVGQRGSAEAITLTADLRQAAVVEDADEAGALSFSPRYGIIAQPHVSHRRVRLVAESLKARRRDSDISFLDTTACSMKQRERGVEEFSRWAEGVIIVGEAHDSSTTALMETARRLGQPHLCTSHHDFSFSRPEWRRIAITAGEFVSPKDLEHWIRSIFYPTTA
jgi:4-hydroxy-3-methylbut-2-enyl diphosphate reductase IspH